MPGLVRFCGQNRTPDHIPQVRSTQTRRGLALACRACPTRQFGMHACVQLLGWDVPLPGWDLSCTTSFRIGKKLHPSSAQSHLPQEFSSSFSCRLPHQQVVFLLTKSSSLGSPILSSSSPEGSRRSCPLHGPRQKGRL